MISIFYLIYSKFNVNEHEKKLLWTNIFPDKHVSWNVTNFKSLLQVSFQEKLISNIMTKSLKRVYGGVHSSKNASYKYATFKKISKNLKKNLLRWKRLLFSRKASDSSCFLGRNYRFKVIIEVSKIKLLQVQNWQ